MQYVIFCHGFGFTEQFWEPLLPYFSGVPYTVLDLGYFGTPTAYIPEGDHDFIGIGHSFGLLKLLDLPVTFRCLIGLNGFLDFLSALPMRHARSLELQLLQTHFIQNPIATLKAFYTRCGVPAFKDQYAMKSLHVDRMVADLQQLQLSVPPPKNVPLLLMGATNDVVVPPSIMLNTARIYPDVTVDILDTGGHGLGFLEADIIYPKLEYFIHDVVSS